MTEVAVLTNNLQYEFFYKRTKLSKKLEEKPTKFNEFLSDIRNLNQQIIHLIQEITFYLLSPNSILSEISRRFYSTIVEIINTVYKQLVSNTACN